VNFNFYFWLNSGISGAEARGKFVVYRLSDPRVEELLRLAETLLADVARGVYECTRYSVEERS